MMTSHGFPCMGSIFLISILFSGVKIGAATLYNFKVNAYNYYFLGALARAALS